MINIRYAAIYVTQLFPSPILWINCYSTKAKTTSSEHKIFSRKWVFAFFKKFFLLFSMQYFKMRIEIHWWKRGSWLTKNECNKSTVVCLLSGKLCTVQSCIKTMWASVSSAQLSMFQYPNCQMSVCQKCHKDIFYAWSPQWVSVVCWVSRGLNTAVL